MILRFDKITDEQYLVLDVNKQMFGHLVKDLTKTWVFYLDKKNIVLTIEELEQLLEELKELNKVSPNN